MNDFRFGTSPLKATVSEDVTTLIPIIIKYGHYSSRANKQNRRFLHQYTMPYKTAEEPFVPEFKCWEILRYRPFIPIENSHKLVYRNICQHGKNMTCVFSFKSNFPAPRFIIIIYNYVLMTTICTLKVYCLRIRG